MKYPQKIVISTSTLALAAMLTYAGIAAPGGPPLPPNGPPPQAPPPLAPPPSAPPRSPTNPAQPTSTTPIPPVVLPPTLQSGTFVDASGQLTTINISSSATAANPFFHPLGTNGRTCQTCHNAATDYSITPNAMQALFASTGGTAPIFATVDGSNSPDAPVATVAERETAYSELLTKGLIRIGLPLPSGAQFMLAAVADPYNFASASQLSLFRRPLPTTNLTFLSTVMFDGRETIPNDTIDQDLAAQAANAVETHEQGTAPPTPAQLAQIVDFETANYTAQTFDNHSGMLSADGETGGPVALSGVPFALDENLPQNTGFNPLVFTDFIAWSSASSTAAQQSIARGEQIFDTHPIAISGVAGLNDVLNEPVIHGTCTSCHNSTEAGSHSAEAFLDLGLTDPGRITPDLPQYTLKNTATGATRVTSDPGRAMITGQWADIGKFKVPTLRGLAGRAPYFHNGFAPDLQHVVGFYNQRFNIGLNQQQQTDLANFLNTL